MRLLWVLCVLCLWPGLLQAQSSEPLIVTADEQLEWDRTGRVFTARGDAVASQGEATLRAPVLIARYSEQNGRNSVSRIEAEGGLVFTDRGSSVIGDQGFYDIESGYAEVTGRNLKLINGNDHVSATQRMTYNALDKELKAHGNAIALRGEDSLAGDVLIARFRTLANGQNELRQIEAIGSVRIVTPTEEITGNRALYDADTQLAGIEGNVVIMQGQNRLTGDRGSVNLQTNISTLFAAPAAGPSGVEEETGRVRGVFFPK